MEPGGAVHFGDEVLHLVVAGGLGAAVFCIPRVKNYSGSEASFKFSPFKIFSFFESHKISAASDVSHFYKKKI